MSNSNLVSQATTYLRGLSRRRSSGIVTADDMVNFLTRKRVRVSQNERISLTRQVLNASNFEAVGTVPSVRTEAKSRHITAWTVA
jgi:hypothetical protein